VYGDRTPKGTQGRPWAARMVVWLVQQLLAPGKVTAIRGLHVGREAMGLLGGPGAQCYLQRRAAEGALRPRRQGCRVLWQGAAASSVRRGIGTHRGAVPFGAVLLDQGVAGPGATDQGRHCSGLALPFSQARGRSHAFGLVVGGTMRALRRRHPGAEAFRQPRSRGLRWS